MSYAGRSWLKLDWCRALLLFAVPTACAVGVDPTFEGGGADPEGAAGTSPAAGGMPGTSGSGSGLPKAGTTASGGSAIANPFGGSMSAGTGGGSSAGSAAGGAGGAGSSSAGAAGKGSGGGAGAGTGGTGGTGSGGCACPTKKTWADNTNLAIAPGDCVDVAGAVYLYTGTKTQTYANIQCNPAKQEAWCTDSGNDYKFMLCK